MSRDDQDFRPQLGRIRDGQPRVSRRSQTFVGQVMKAAAKANGGPVTLAQMRRAEKRSGGTRGAHKGRCSRIGRGQHAATTLKSSADARRAAGERSRRVVVKARIVRLKLASRAADAHLRYLQRDGTTRDGERGRLYGPETDAADGGAFLERGREDRHQFRFIVAPEDGDRLSDLRGFTRDVVGQMEADLGTRLDWVAVDHFNTGHPHSHVVIRGKDDLGKDLIIAQDYITDGIRIRAQERVTLELGPETNLELRTKLQAEVAADRFTRIERAMIKAAEKRVIDLRPDSGQVGAAFDRTLRIGRLQKLGRMGLAKETEPGIWTISDRLEPTLRELGERGDIIKAMNRMLANRGQERSPEMYALHGGHLQEPVTGLVIGKRLADELDDWTDLIIDGVDGRVHHVPLAHNKAAQDVPVGAVVEIGRAPSGPRPADRNIAEMARGTGEYLPYQHQLMAEAGNVRVPGGDYEAYVESHVRRLEALRRAGIVERVDQYTWRIPQDYEARAMAYDARRGRGVLQVLSVHSLGRQVTSEGATWLDRQIVRGHFSHLAEAGFGAEVRKAILDRQEEWVRREYVRRTPDGRVVGQADIIEFLERKEINRIGRKLAQERGLEFTPVRDGQTFRGTLSGSAQLASCKFAMIEDGLGFSLVPWRPEIENQIGRQVSGIIRGGHIDWELGRKRGLGR